MGGYYIIVYDVEVKRVNKVHKLLNKYLFWIQNSVFEGYLEDSKFNQLLKRLKNIIDIERDFIVIYKLRSNNVLYRKTIGQERKKYEFIV